MGDHHRGTPAIRVTLRDVRTRAKSSAVPGGSGVSIPDREVSDAYSDTGADDRVSDDRGKAEQSATPVRVRTPHATVEAFARALAHRFSRSSVVLDGVSALPVDTLVRFEITLSDGTIVLRGEGRVLAPSEQRPWPGVALRFTRLDSRSKELIDRLVASSRDVPTSMPPPSIEPLPLPSIVPARPSNPRPSLESLELALDALLRDAEANGVRESVPTPDRRSLEQLSEDLERLSVDIPLRDRSVVPDAPRADAKPAVTVPPRASDYTGLPPVLGLLEADGELRSALTPPPPAPDTAAMRPSAPAPSKPIPTAPPPQAMREPTPIPGEGTRASPSDVPSYPAIRRHRGFRAAMCTGGLWWRKSYRISTASSTRRRRTSESARAPYRRTGPRIRSTARRRAACGSRRTGSTSAS